MNSKAKEFLSGVKASVPILIGVVPFGMIYGALSMEVGIPVSVTQAMSTIVFAGSAQFVATQMIGMSAPGVVIVLTIGIINMRHLLYSASIAPYLRGLKWPWKCCLAYFLTDEAYAVSITHFKGTEKNSRNLDHQNDKNQKKVKPHRYLHWHLLGAGLALWSVWQASTAAGIMLGAVVPPTWSLDFTLALTLIALVVPNLNDRASVVSAVTAGIIALAAFTLPYKLGLVLAALIGIFIGMTIERVK